MRRDILVRDQRPAAAVQLSVARPLHRRGRLFESGLAWREQLRLPSSGRATAGGAATHGAPLIIATVVAPLFVFPMILLGGLYANVGAIPAGARWINKVNPINYGFQAVSQAQWFSTVSEP